jgi:hypothetical protein
MFWYYDTFTKPDDAPTCLAFATDAFGQNKLKVFLAPGNGFATLAGAADSSVIVQVACAPQDGHTWVMVTAFSDNNNLAKTTRDKVQAYIQSVVRMD